MLGKIERTGNDGDEDFLHLVATLERLRASHGTDAPKHVPATPVAPRKGVAKAKPAKQEANDDAHARRGSGKAKNGREVGTASAPYRTRAASGLRWYCLLAGPSAWPATASPTSGGVCSW